MGIETHGFNFLRWIASLQEFRGRVMTIGRQNLQVDGKILERVTRKQMAESGYCEEALIALGAEKVESIDVSDYEGATYTADLGKPYSHPHQYDIVCDFGTLEHIFDIGTAFRNVIGLCQVGGQIVHLLPVNNLDGHGFWQFSSDLLHTIYSEKNGFQGTEVFYASGIDHRFWFKAPLPIPGVRIEVSSIEPIVLLCKTKKIRESSDLDVMQPYYLQSWSAESTVRDSTRSPASTARLKGAVRRLLVGFPAVYVAVRNCWMTAGLAMGISRHSVWGRPFRRVRVSELLGDK